jgi:3-hydroxybutyryl-CoA dehydrogenase
MSSINEVAVIGSGIMGNGIAQTFAASGFQVKLFDLNEEILGRAMKEISGSLGRLVKKKTLTEDGAKEVLGRISTVAGGDYAELSSSDLLIDVVPEKLEIKEAVLKKAAAKAKASAIITSNTSSISITKLAAFVPKEQQERFAGLHFFNPVPVMKLVEVIRGLQTSDATNEALLSVCKRINKTGVPCIDAPGFVCNRVLVPMINEAIFAVFEGVAKPAEVDQVLKLGANHPMGPLSLADMIGLDTILSVMEVMHKEMGDDKYRPCPLLRQKVYAGHLGRKTGKGFFDYSSKL